MTTEEIQAEIDNKVKAIQAAPPWKLYIGGAVLLLVIAWLGWVVWDMKHPKGKPGSVTTAAPLTEEFENFETEIITTTTTYYPEKGKAEDKLKIPRSNNAKELLVTGSEIEANKYGAKTAVYHNTSTAGYRTAVKYNEAPWFAFKRDLAIGVGGGISTQGTAYAGRVRLDVMQIKEVTISPEIELNYAANRKEPVESRALIWAEWRP
jgi:hypothetical protein